MSEKSKNISLWRSLDGRETRVCDLENTHLINVIRHVLKRVNKVEMKPAEPFTLQVGGLLTDYLAEREYIALSELAFREMLMDEQYRNDKKILHELTDEALQRGYTLDEMLSSIPVYTLSKDDQEHLSVYADHFEEVGNMNLANFMREIIKESKKHAVRTWSNKKV